MTAFSKMNGAGNDFVVIDNRDNAIRLSREDIALLCDRHRGVGADGLLLAEPPQAGGEIRMRYYNSDGGEAEMCGNGARCFARFVNRLHGFQLTSLAIETMAGRICAAFEGDEVRVRLSEPRDLRLSEDLEVNGERLTVHSVDTGVPHAVVVVPDAGLAEVNRLGAALRHHPRFAPRGTNVNFQEVLGASHLRIRTYERGVEGETLACGTGVVANALIHHALTGDPAPVAVRVAGGDILTVGFRHTGAGYDDVTLQGPADFVFEGTIQPPRR